MVHFADEIWINILQYLQLDLWVEETRSRHRPTESVQLPPGPLALSRLCRVSKRFQELAEPILYQELPPWKGQGAAARLPLLLRTLSTRRDIARSVKRLNYRTWLNCYPHGRHAEEDHAIGSTPQPDGDILRTFQEVSLWFDPPEPYMMLPKECLRCIAAALEQPESQGDAQLVMLMIMLPNLERLDMYPPVSPDIHNIICNFFIWHAEEIQDTVENMELDRLVTPVIGSDMASKFSSTPLAHLKELGLSVQYNYDDPGYQENDPIQISDLEPLLLHRGIHTLRVHRLNWGGIAGRQTGWTDNHLSLKHVSITAAKFNVSGFCNLVSRCQNLRTLFIDFSFESQDLHAEELGAILRNYCKSLESLSLSYLSARDEGLGSLQNFHSLKKLVTTPIILLGQPSRKWTATRGNARLADVLPASLEVLHLEDDWNWSGEDAALLEREVCNLPLEDHLPNIRRIRWNYSADIPAFPADFACPGWIVLGNAGEIVLTKLE